MPRACSTSDGLDTIFLLSPTTTDERIRQAGAPGPRIPLRNLAARRDRRARRLSRRARRPRRRGFARETSLPLALGFGISHPDHVREIGRVADAAVVGSALVQVIADAGDSEVAGAGGRRLRALAEGRHGRSRAGAGDRPGAGRVTLDELRQRIDALDERLVELLNERASCALRDRRDQAAARAGGLSAGARVAGAGPRARARGGARRAAGRRGADATVRTNHRRSAPARTRVGTARRESEAGRRRTPGAGGYRPWWS